MGDAARNDRDAFTKTCDVFASFITYYALVVIDRDVQQSDGKFTWTGRFASLRRSSPRFGLAGVGSSTFGGGGWDFHRLTLACDRATGELTLSAEPIRFPIKPAPVDPATAAWQTEELKLMGWKPLKSIDFFGDTLFPPEYNQAADEFDPDNERPARDLVHRRHLFDRALPVPELFLGLLYDHAGRREKAARLVDAAASYQYALPQTLVDAARWEFHAGLDKSARKHADAALKLWLNNPTASQLIRDLDARKLVTVRAKILR